MADNVQLNSPTTAGATIATDEISGVQHQLIKIEFGIDGESIMVSDANPLPVSVDSLPLPTGAATVAAQTTQSAILNDIESETAAIQVNTNNLDVELSTRLKPADTLAGVTTVGSITNVVHIDDNGGSITVDGDVTVSGVATESKQDSQITLQNTLQELTETLQELASRLVVLSAVRGVQESLRVTPISSVSTAVTGSLTGVTTVNTVLALSNYGTYPTNIPAWAQTNLTAIHSNINNVSV